MVRSEYSGPALKVVLFDRSGHFGRSDRNVPFHLTKLLSPVPLFCILLARTITKRAVAWVGSVEPECTVPLNTENFRNFKPEFLLNGKRPKGSFHSRAGGTPSGLMETCGQPGYVFRDFCLKQGIDFIIFCLKEGIISWTINSLRVRSTNVLNRVSKIDLKHGRKISEFCLKLRVRV